jgi:hypothetical protein
VTPSAEREARDDVPTILAMMKLEQYAVELRDRFGEEISAETVSDVRLGELRGKVIAAIESRYAAELREREPRIVEVRGRKGFTQYMSAEDAAGWATITADDHPKNAPYILTPLFDLTPPEPTTEGTTDGTTDGK